MVDAFRAQLDALMGVDRNGDRVRPSRAKAMRARSFRRRHYRAFSDARFAAVMMTQGAALKDYRDKSVCRLFLEGLCPCDLFVNTVRCALCALWAVRATGAETLTLGRARVCVRALC